MDAIPKSAKKITILDKTREETSKNPFYLDCFQTIKTYRPELEVLGGCYGLASKPFTPNMIRAIYDNMKLDKPKDLFTVGIEDDVYHTSIPIDNSKE